MKIVLVFLLLISTCFAFAQDASPNEIQVYWNGFKGDISVFDANTNNKIIDHLPYDAVENTMYNNVLVVVKNDRYGLVNSTGKVLLKPTCFLPENAYTSVFEFGTEHIYFHQEPKMGAIDYSGKSVLKPIVTNRLTEMGYGFIAFGDDETFGIINNNKIIYPQELTPNYFEPMGFSTETHQPTIVVTKNGLKGLFHKNGTLVVPTVYDEIQLVDHQYYIMYRAENTDFADQDGKIISSTNKLYVEKVIDGIVYGHKDYRYGALRVTGEILVPFEYDDLQQLSTNGIIALRKENLWAITRNDEVNKAIFQYDRLLLNSLTSNDLMLAEKEGKLGFVNSFNQEVLPFEYTTDLDIGTLGEDRFILKKENKYGLFDEMGRLLYPCSLDTLVIGEEYEWAKQDGKFGKIDRDGEILIPFAYDSIANLLNYLDAYPVKNNGKWGVYLTGQQEILPTEYDSILSMESNFILAAKNGKWHLFSDVGDRLNCPAFEQLYETLPTDLIFTENGILKDYYFLEDTLIPLSFDNELDLSTTKALHFGAVPVEVWDDFTESYQLTSSGGRWYFIDAKTNRLLAPPLLELGPFNAQGQAVAKMDRFFDQLSVVNAFGKEVYPDFHLENTPLFSFRTADPSEEMQLQGFAERGIDTSGGLQALKQRYAIESTTVFEYENDYTEKLLEYSIYDLKNYAGITLELPNQPQLLYNFNVHFKAYGPPNAAGWLWAIPEKSVAFQEDEHGRPIYDLTRAVLVNATGEVKVLSSLPNVVPMASLPFYTEINRYGLVDTSNVDSLLRFAPQFRQAFHANNAMTDTEVVQRYKDSVFVTYQSYSTYDAEQFVEYTEQTSRFYIKKNLQLLNYPPPAQPKLAFYPVNWTQVKGVVSPPETELFYHFEQTPTPIYTFSGQRFFNYTAADEYHLMSIEAYELESDPNFSLYTSPTQRARALDRFKFQIETGLAHALNSYSDEGYDDSNVYQTTMFGYANGFGAVADNRMVLQPKYAVIGQESYQNGFKGLVAADFNGAIVHYNWKTHTLSAPTAEKLVKVLPEVMITVDTISQSLQLYPLGTRESGGLLIAQNEQHCWTGIKRLAQFNAIAEPVTMTTNFGATFDVVILEEDTLVFSAESQFAKLEHIDAIERSDGKWFSLPHGAVIGAPSVEQLNTAIYINEVANVPVHVTPQNTNFIVKTNENTSLVWSKAEQLSIRHNYPDQNGFGGFYRNNQFISYQTGLPFPEQHNVYIHIDADDWLVGDWGKLFLVKLGADNAITERFEQTFHSVNELRFYLETAEKEVAELSNFISK